MTTNESLVLRADGKHPTPSGSAAGEAGPSASNVVAASASVTVDVSRLILGREIRFPIHDRAGVLLLREGSVITAEFKRKLESRQIGTVSVHRDDAGTIAFDAPGAGGGPPAVTRATQYDSAASRKLEGALSEGLPFVTNQGPAVRRSVVYHGQKAYDPDRRKALDAQNEQTASALQAMMTEAIQGASLDGNGLAAAAAQHLGHLTADMDQTLSVPMELGRDAALSQHCVQLSMLGMAIAIELGLNAENVSRVGVTGLVHDWGMLRVPREIRDADRRLSEAEMLEVRKHPIYALDILDRVSGLPSLVPLISYQVHEKLDGSGYPRGRVERNIHLFARILHVADIYIALTSPRPWRAAHTPYAAMRSLLSGDNGHGCDPLVLRALLRVKSLFPVGSYVTLSDSSVAQVLRANGDKYTQPIVQLVQDAKGRPLHGTDDAAILDLTASPLSVAEALPTLGRHELTAAPQFARPHHMSASPAHAGVNRPHVPLASAAGPAEQRGGTGGRTHSAESTPRPHLRTTRKPTARRSVLRRET